MMWPWSKKKLEPQSLIETIICSAARTDGFRGFESDADRYQGFQRDLYRQSYDEGQAAYAKAERRRSRASIAPARMAV